VTAVLAASLLAACASADRSRPAPESTPSARPTPQGTELAEETSPGGVDVPRALRFTAPALGGGTIDGADFAGHDLAMWFWAPW
jgi:hypothetical protein